MKEEGRRKSWNRKLMYFLGVVGIVCALIGAYCYVVYIQESLMMQTIANVQTVTQQQQVAFDSFIARDRERIHSYSEDFSRLSSTDVESIQKKLEVFSSVDAIYSVVNLDTGEYYTSKSPEAFRMSEEEMEDYRHYSGSGVREPYIGLYTKSKMFGYYECFTFEDGARGMFQKGYESDRVSGEFTLSFYNDQGFAYLINQQGDVLMRPFANENDYIGENIFDMFDDKENGREQLATLKEALSKQETGAVVAAVPHDRVGDYVYAYVPIKGVDGWYLISIVPRGAIMDEANRVISSSQIAIVIAIAVMVVLFVFVFFMWRARKELLQKELEKDYKEQQFHILANYLANNTDDAYIMLAEDKCTIEYASPNFERVIGIPAKSDLLKLKILEYADRGEKTQEKGLLKSLEVERPNPKTGEHKWLQENLYCAYIQNKKKYIIYISDRTAEREVQNSLTTALNAAKVASQAKSTFLSSVSHDIRTPMNAIIGLVTLLQQEAHDPKIVLDYAKKIEASSQHLLGLINDVLDMNKVESGNVMLNVEEINLAEVMEGINSIIRPQIKAKDQTMDIYASGFRHEHLMGDKTRINQIFINILSNAVKYTPKGGRIEMTVKELPQISEGFSCIQFKVKDNGQGMSEEYQKVIFEPFTREQNSMINEIQGTGLGMAITKSLVDLMGGTISVESKLNEGSVFTVELNLRIQEKEDDAEFWNEHRIRRIIVADDDKDICETVVQTLSEKGIIVDYVTDGEDVIRTIREARERNEPYDLLLLDWQMPKLSGLEVARLVRKNYPDKIPILLFTAYDWTEIEKEAMEVGIDHFMPKPFFISTFKEAIKRLMYTSLSASPALAQPEESIVKGKHILIVEDNKVNQFVLQKILSSRGATYDVADDGEKAVQMFEASKPGEYDFILMDVKMPVMDGYQATRVIRAGSHPCAKTIPIIAMTANAFADDVVEALDSGMDAHVAKPIILEQLERTIKEVLERTKN